MLPISTMRTTTSQLTEHEQKPTTYVLSNGWFSSCDRLNNILVVFGKLTENTLKNNITPRLSRTTFIRYAQNRNIEHSNNLNRDIAVNFTITNLSIWAKSVYFRAHWYSEYFFTCSQRILNDFACNAIF